MRRKFELQREKQKEALPLRLQAYERVSLLMERIAPAKLMLRIAPIGDNKQQYASLLIQTIEQEFDHNLAQQIYMSEDCWNIIRSSKNEIVQVIRKNLVDEEVTNAQTLREKILNQVITDGNPTEDALRAIKSEVADIF
ncbi:hypothetical protein NBT05_13160 [Aquimarina sp. ERC-38]|uniref:DUF7935 family protein n=1 Tax=Aquimarina sp. ERC-38 TaxID=2949996 RepID=UPI00224620A2|nr:hypothetical protein [Aquimarina sp. ERC-38]UZO79893.1 hypothetical protein NBT05_13160 [Aquimarina sp. ERC-38]